MELVEAQKLAVTLMSRHGLIEAGWKFKFDGATKRLGLCTYTTKTISVSRHMAAAGTLEQVEQVILHEIAHALTGAYNRFGQKIGHGPVWKAQARAIGYKGKTLAVNPYVEAQHSVMRADVTVAELSTPQIRLYDEVRIENGRIGTVIGIARVNYKVDTHDGDFWSARIGSVVKVADRKPSVVAAAVNATVTMERFRRGQVIRTVSPNGGKSKYNGLAGTISRVGSKNYTVTLEDKRILTVPHSWAVAATI